MIKRFVIPLSVALLVLTYQNCGQSFLDTDRESSDSSSSQFSATSFEIEYKVTNPVALLSGEQVFKSMASVTGVPATNTAANDEFNRRSGLFAANYNVSSINSPMLIGFGNLASVFCDQTLTSEIGAANVNRRFFNDVNFTLGAANVSDAQFLSSVNRMATAFWGRSPSSEESNTLRNAKAAFLADYTATELNNSTSTRRLALFACTAMLASTDSYTF